MENNNSQERTEQATPKRLKEAREQGQVPQSRDLNTLLVLMAGSVSLLMMGKHIIEKIIMLIHRSLSIEHTVLFDTAALPARLGTTVLEALGIVSPLFVVVLVAALIGPIVMGGWTFSAKSLQFKWEKLDPIKGLGRIIAWRGFMELAKSLAKFILVALISGILIWQFTEELLALGDEPLRQGIAHAGHLLTWSFVGLSAALILIAIVDVPFQLWDHNRQLKMTRQEVKDEQKETDGSPEVKRRIRKVQLEMAQRRMMQEVPKADVIIVNPNHVAVALKFDYKMNAPKVVAKGVDLIAERIRQIADQHGVTIFSAPLLARALYHSTELNQEIPAGLYVAVAKVLAYVFQLRETDPQAHSQLEFPTDLPIPDELTNR